MKIFILEDSEERIIDLIENLKGHDITICRDVPKAMEFFKPPYQLMLLDHDLGPDTLNGVKNDGTFFCDWLVSTQSGHGAERVIIHSFNLDGGKRMLKTLALGGYQYGRWQYGHSLLHWLKHQPVNPVVGGF